MGTPTDPVIRYWSKVDKRGPDECWPWTASCSSWGYGVFWNGTRQVRAHRFGYELHYGPIPQGKRVCHSCDNPPCQNPKHWFLGTQADNLADMRMKGRDVMPRPEQAPRGERNAHARLSQQQVEEIRSLAGRVRADDLARRYGVTARHVRKIIQGNTWKL